MSDEGAFFIFGLCLSGAYIYLTATAHFFWAGSQLIVPTYLGPFPNLGNIPTYLGQQTWAIAHWAGSQHIPWAVSHMGLGLCPYHAPFPPLGLCPIPLPSPSWTM